MSSNDVSQLARDLDKAPSGEVIIERLLTAQVKLQRENAELKAGQVKLQRDNKELKAQLDQVLDKAAGPDQAR